MTAIELECLKVICQAAIKTNDNYVLSVELPVGSQDERNAVCKSLEVHGFISKVNLHGRKKVGCQVNNRAFPRVEE